MYALTIQTLICVLPIVLYEYNLSHPLPFNFTDSVTLFLPFFSVYMY